MKDVLKCITTTAGEQCVMMDSIMQQQVLLATLSVSGASIHLELCACVRGILVHGELVIYHFSFSDSYDEFTVQYIEHVTCDEYFILFSGNCNSNLQQCYLNTENNIVIWATNDPHCSAVSLR